MIAHDSENADLTVKESLSAILDGDESVLSGWVRSEIAPGAQVARGQSIDPVTLSIVGVILVGVILASRVKKAGNVEFYKGIPDQVKPVLKSIASGGSN